MFWNREIKQIVGISVVMTAILAGIGFWIHVMAGVLVLGTAIGLSIVFARFTKKRYQRLTEMAERIDHILHEEDELYICSEEEGELAILESEISKMTLRIREQNDALRKEKQHLADSMADIAHQLRTPLTSANVILALLKNPMDEQKRRSLLGETQKLYRKMEWLIHALLKLSRLDAGIVEFQSEKISVKQLIQESLRPFSLSMDLHEIQTDIDVPEQAVITGDFGWLSEALQNIFKNSMENMNDGGKLEITCTDTVLYTEIRLHDSGEGFSPEDLPHIFERFYRSIKTQTSGYGIGLALCRTIILRQNGTIQAKNHPDGGAVFDIRFPK